MGQRANCLNGKKAFAVCINQNCINNPFICAQQLQCQSNHHKCKTFMWFNYMNLIQSKNKLLNQSHNQIKNLDVEFKKALNKFSEVAKKIQQIQQSFKLNDNETKVLNIIQKQQFNNLNGSILANAYESLSMDIFINSRKIQQIEYDIRQLNQISENMNKTLQQDFVFKEELKKFNTKTKSKSKLDKIKNKQYKSSNNNSQENYISSIIVKTQEDPYYEEIISYSVSQDLIIVQNNEWKWVDHTRGKYFTVNNNIVTRIKQCQNYYDNTLILINKKLQNQKNKWIIKLLNGYTEIGVCFKEIIKQNRYGFPEKSGYQHIDHGIYSISPSRRVFSHHDKSKNNKKLGFEFFIGDRILVTYLPQKMLVKFKLLRNNSEFHLQIQNPTNYQIYPCVFLGNASHSAELINIQK